MSSEDKNSRMCETLTVTRSMNAYFVALELDERAIPASLHAYLKALEARRCRKEQANEKVNLDDSSVAVPSRV